MNNMLLYKNDEFELKLLDFTVSGYGSELEHSKNIVITNIKTNNIALIQNLFDFNFIIENYKCEPWLMDFCLESELFIITKKDQHILFECNNNFKLKLL